MLDDIRFIFYTNKNNFHIGELCVKYFLKHNKREDLKVSLISNDFPDKNFKFSDKITYLNANVERKDNGSHFAQTMLSVLPEIKEKYVFFFCDDYFFIEETKYDDLRELLDMMDCDGIDYFGFDEIGEFKRISEYKKYISSCENKYKDHFYIRERDYRYLFSVQACIWNKESFHELLKRHDNISLHNLDETLDVMKYDNTYKTLCNDLVSIFNFDDIEQKGYYIIAYHELIRHGCFWLPENGHSMGREHPGIKFMYQLIQDEDLLNDPDFKQNLFWYYDKHMGTNLFNKPEHVK
jgi:hypothetical protein